MDQTNGSKNGGRGEQADDNDRPNGQEWQRKGRRLAGIGAFFAGTAVALGAFGAHGLKKILSEPKLLVYHTGVEYQMYHGLALLALGMGVWVLALQASQVTADLRRFYRGGLFLILGTLIFSGTLYVYTMADVRIAAMITPVGGVSFLIGWGLIVVAFFQSKRSS